MKKDLISKNLYFKGLDEMDTSALLRCLSASLKNYKKDEIIVLDGSETQNLYIILDGYARSYYLDIQGQKILSQDYQKNSIFGLDYLVNSNTYNEYLIALEDTSVLIVNKFRSVTPCQNRCKRHVDFLKLLINELSIELHASKKRINILAKTKTRDKILAFLNYYQQKNKKRYFTIPFNRNEMAEFLQVERSAMSSELNKLKKEGIIDFEKNKFHLKSNKLKLL